MKPQNKMEKEQWSHHRATCTIPEQQVPKVLAYVWALLLLPVKVLLPLGWVACRCRLGQLMRLSQMVKRLITQWGL
jgi:hypothetical protein